MGHCSGGPGAWQIGQTTLGAVGEEYTPETNVLARIVAWVEQGEAPEWLEGVKYVNDTFSEGVELTRRHCKWPKRNVCVDPSRVGDVDAWKCV